MSKLFYPKLALSNIKKNRQTYLPYLLTCICTIMMFYLLSSIMYNKNMKNVYGAENLKSLLAIALVISGIFAVTFLFYTNSFLMKRRQKEIGLYNILGMEKRHIAKMMCFETLFIMSISLIAGILMGIVFSKLVFLLLLKLISFKVILGFDIQTRTLIITIILFVCIFMATLLYNIMKIRFTKTIELLHSTESGEKEPKTKIILTLVGLGCIGWGYWFALTVKSPLQAINLFFIAVIAVVIGTYALFTAGSIAILKLLRRNKKFFYKTSHFTSVSGMLYRMKQNAVGLANICILSTMVLILFSTTVSLYVGVNDSVNARYPYDMSVDFYMNKAESTEAITKNLDQIIAKSDVQVSEKVALHSFSIVCKKQDNHFQMQSTGLNVMSAGELNMVAVVPLDEFNQLNKSNYKLEEGEVLLYTKSNKNQLDDFELGNETQSRKFRVKEKLHKIENNLFFDYENIVDTYVVVVNNLHTLEDLHNITLDTRPGKMIEYDVMFNTDTKGEELTRLSKNIQNDLSLDPDQVELSKADSREDARNSFYGLYGGMLFIGLFLGILFLMATVLLIYYKQISEGFDDRKRFEIMQKVGLSRLEVKKTIRSQVLFVFFLPLIVAGVHVTVSFGIIKKMLLLLGLTNGNLFILCTVISLAFFCIIYGIVFAITAKVYYRIVSNE